jgi:hypothetical protein
MCECGAPTLTWSAFDSHAMCSECMTVRVAARGTRRGNFDVLSVETFLREFAADSHPRLGGMA